MSSIPLRLGNDPVSTGDSVAIINPWDGAMVGEVSMAGESELQACGELAEASREQMKALPPHRRSEILQGVAQGIRRRRDELAATIRREAGKPIALAEGEVDRAVQTFTFAAEAIKAQGGQGVNLGAVPKGEGRHGILRRFPVGPVLGITPFNFPLNLVAHKVAPAIAAGCPIVIKPAERTPLSALTLGEICQEAGLPHGGLSVVPCDRSVAHVLNEDERFKVLSFTGSDKVGWDLKAKAGKKKVVLELGGDAPVILGADVDIDAILPRLALGAYAYAGQVCISIQRILVHGSRLKEFCTKASVYMKNSVVSGNPSDPGVMVGPLIDSSNGRRVDEWIDEAMDRGARALVRGGKDGSVLTPSLLRGVAPETKLGSEEVFGPVAHVQSFGSWEEAASIANASRYGLQAGVFTNDLKGLFTLYDALEVGGVIHNDIPTWRVDNMPYGGVKDSGLGREGVHYAIRDFSEDRLLAIKP